LPKEMNKASTKIFVGNLPEACRRNDLQEIFEKYGKVDECDVLKNYGFVHMTVEEEAHAAIEALNNSDLLGNTITVEASRSKVRPRPGMGGKGQCFRCGKAGHWSKDCPLGPNSMRNGYGGRTDNFGGPPSGMYRDRMAGRFGAPERMRPYPELYDRPIPSMAGPATRAPSMYNRQDPIGRPPPPDYMYRRRSPPPPPIAPPRYAAYDPYQVPPPTSYPTLENTESYQSYLSVLKFVKDAGI
jgi:RNA-binding protein 4